VIIPTNFNLAIRPGTTFRPVVFRAVDLAGNPVPLEGFMPFAEVRSAPRAALLMDLGAQLAATGDVGTFTVDPATDLFTAPAHGLLAGLIVRFASSGTVPAGIDAGTDYFVVGNGLTLDTFKISATANGTPLDVTDAGSGTHTVSIPAGQIIIPEITDEETHDMADFSGRWDLMLEDALGKRDAPYVSGTFTIAAGITNPAEPES